VTPGSCGEAWGKSPSPRLRRKDAGPGEVLRWARRRSSSLVVARSPGGGVRSRVNPSTMDTVRMLRASVLCLAVVAGSLVFVSASSGLPGSGGSACVKGKPASYGRGVWLGCKGHVVLQLGSQRFRFKTGACAQAQTIYQFQGPGKEGPNTLSHILIVVTSNGDGASVPKNPDGKYPRNDLAWSLNLLDHGTTVNLNLISATLTITKHGHAGRIRGHVLREDTGKSVAVKGSYTCR
jgi:hypothetical protein